MGFFWAAVPKEHWPTETAELAEIERVSKGPNGDCRQELVFIGADMDRQAIEARFDRALLTEKELQMEKEEWIDRFEDPFPAWDMAVVASDA